MYIKLQGKERAGNGQDKAEMNTEKLQSQKNLIWKKLLAMAEISTHRAGNAACHEKKSLTDSGYKKLPTITWQ